MKLIFKNIYFTSIIIIFPVLIGGIYGYTAKGTDDSLITTAFVDKDNTQLSIELYQRLKSSEGLEVLETSIEKGKIMLEAGEAEAVFVLKEGFEEDLYNLDVSSTVEIITLPSSFAGAFLSEIIASDISVINSRILSHALITERFEELNADAEGLSDRIDEYYNQLTEETPLMQVEYKIINSPDNFEKSNKLIDSQKYMVYGGLLMFIMFFLMFGSGWIIEERENGTLKRLKTVKNGFSTSFWASFSCLVISGIFQAIIFILISVLFGTIVFNDKVIFIALIIFIITASSITMLLASVFKTSMQLNAFTPVFVLLTSFAGSCFVDISLLSETFEMVSLFTPQGITLSALKEISMDSNSLEWLKYSGLLIPVSAVLLFISYPRLKALSN
ncbi:ABC transporter permease [Herbivorax sp. ANBcel31]|uniref:ABC transporter permease n=1 Tax=Herbivorax sp. ANBcel31 TaxID=3069754 RepID=UPI0027B16744|nr:ABC transporter permease [Herbivorax sp. ANBcel31]MDQ2088118.1 ABC transporter permease [Herbivorax sp. ANBcel31]